MPDQSSKPRDPPRDALSAILRDFRFDGVSYGQCQLRRPWAISFPAEETARLHLVVEGQAWLGSGGGAWEHLREGDVALLPRGPGHFLADRKDRPAVPIADLSPVEIADHVFDVTVAGRGRRTIMSCCSVGYDGEALKFLIALMPEIIVVRRDDDSDRLLRTLLDGMAQEVSRQRPGAATMLARFADLVIGSIIRGWAERAPDSASGWLAAIRDPNLGRAIAAIHARPGDDWSADRFAAEAGMSRSSFFARFTSMTGQTPARYLAAVRMGIATTLLRQGKSSIAAAAARLGYESEASFSRAYKRIVGHPPSLARARAGASFRRSGAE